MEEPGQNPEAANFVVENDNTEEQFDDNIVDEMLEPEKEKFHPPGVLEFIDPAMYGEDPMEPGGSAPREMTIEDLICSDDGDEGSSASLYDPGSRGQSCGSSMVSGGVYSSFPASGATSMTVEETIPEQEVVMLAGDEIYDAEDIPVSYHNALILNEEYRQAVDNQLILAERTLSENLARQKQIEEELNELRRGKAVGSGNDARSDGRPGPLNAKRSLTVFQAPYFKDIRGFSHLPNQDTKTKRLNEELDPYLSNPREWSATEKKKLALAVKEDAIRDRSKTFMSRKQDLAAELRQISLTPEKKEELEEALKLLETQIKEVEGTSENDLFYNREEDFDWMRISAQTFSNHITPKACELMWKNLLHPTINKSSWSKEEDRLLRALAEACGGRRWDTIAEELNTGRTGFQCFVRFQQKHNQALSKRKWSEEEDERLKQLVVKCKVNNFIPWTKISYYMDHRTKDQCYQRYMYSLRAELRKGYFTDSEDFMILIGYKLFGTNWAEIAKYMPSRTPIQIHSRYNTFLKSDFKDWSEQDDQKLLQLVKEHGSKDWVKIASHLEGKNRTQCRNRFHVIYKAYVRDQDQFSLNKLNNSSLQRKRQRTLYTRLENKLGEFLECQKELRLEEDEGGFRKVDLQGFHTTADGTKIPRQELFYFMLSLRAVLPVNKNAARTKSITAEKLGVPPRPTSAFVHTNKRGKVIKTLKRKTGGRPQKPPESIYSKSARITKALAQFFRPAWSTPGRTRVQYKPDDLDRVSTAAVGLSHILKCNQSLKFPEANCDQEDGEDDPYADMVFKDIQLIEQFEKKRNMPRTLDPSKAVTFKAPQPKLKTYSRKGNVAPAASPAAEPSSSSASASIPTLDFVPPSHPSLVGFRGLVLHHQYLRRRAQVNHDQAFRRQYDEVLNEGIFHPSIMITASENMYRSGGFHGDASNENKGDKKADELLYQRFKSVFFWPALMSGTRPSVRGYKDMFKTDSEQSSSKSLPARISQKANPRAPISASTPFDATPIIEATKRKTPKKNVMKAIKTEVFDNEEEAYESASNTPMEQDAEEQEEEESKPSTSKASLLLPKKRPYLEH